MKRAISLIVSLMLLLSLSLPPMAFAESLVPDSLPEDLGGKTLYGYLMDLKAQYVQVKVFQDAVKFTDQDRENARRAAQLIIAATSQKMEVTGKPDQYFLYLRANAYELQFMDEKNTELQLKALSDYEKTVELGGSYAQADYDRVAAMEVQAAPLAWQVPQMLTLNEIGQILGVAGGNLYYLDIENQHNNNWHGVGYALQSVPDPFASAIFVLAEPLGGKPSFDVLKRTAFLNKMDEVPGLGDEAVVIGLRNLENNPILYTTALVLKDKLVLQVRVPDHVWRGAGYNADPMNLAIKIAEKVIENIYNADRTVPDITSIVLDDILIPLQLNPGLLDSSVPDEIPLDLEGKTIYGYLVELRKKYLPKDAFTNPKYSDADKNNTRKAIRLMVNTISKGFEANGQNPYELEIRGACYAAAFEDTGNPIYRQLAINDYKQAMHLGYPLAKPDYDKLVTPLLSPMAELTKGDTGGYVQRMQQWLIQAGYLSGKADGSFGNGTQKAVKAYEQDNALTPDGIADIAFLLSLYAKIEDGDVMYFE